MNYIYHPQAMHLHACNQMGASMESHMANAAALGMQYIRFTGHDIRMGRRKYEIDRFDFTRHMLEYSDYPKQTIRLVPTSGIKWRFVGDALELTADDEAGMTLTASGKRETRPLASDVTLIIGISGSARVRLDITLSQRPPEHKPAHFFYDLSPEVPLHTLHVSADIPEELGGLDNSLAGITLLVSKGTVRLDRFEIISANSFSEILRIQRETADKIGARYGIKPFVTFEISDAGQHKNCYSTRVPIIDYAAHSWHVTACNAVEHLKKYDAVFSYNHPFDRYKHMKLTDVLRAHLVGVTASDLIAAKVWGAQILEVGFPDGRSGFTLAEHLHLWDLLSLAGIFITGDGDSDSHYSNRGWLTGNNFATWIAADAAAEFPIPEEEFEASMHAGRVYMGDPTMLRGRVDFTADSLPMGAVFVHTDATCKHAHNFRFIADGLENGWTVRVITDGMVMIEQTIDSEKIELAWDYAPQLTVSFVRVEMYNAEGRCILLTNPIYMINSDNFAGEIPACRIYTDRAEPIGGMQ
jgi:hypothetical protein